jgi:peptidoglycan-N-acetylglucosamine deacetylase
VRPWVLVLASCKACGLALALRHHPGLGALLFFGPDPWLFLQFVHPGAQAFGPAATSFSTGRAEVWLTIDDGPDPASTPRVLELLAAHQARATFFVVGERVAKHPELARRIAAEGHGLANHTQTHPVGAFWLAGPRRVAAEIDHCTAALLMANAPFEHYFRPPVGVRNPFLARQLSSRGMLQVLWSARGLDGSGKDPAAALRRIAPRIRPGAILLSHEAGAHPKERVDFVELLLGLLQRQGYACVLPPRESLRAGSQPLVRPPD